MNFTVDDEAGSPVSFECPDTLSSRWTCGAILEGRTYPLLPFVGEVRTVLDVGANCGAFSVHVSRAYPQAVIHAFEPGREAQGYLQRNVAELGNVVVHPFGLHESDQEATLHLDAEDLGKASVLAPAGGAIVTETIRLRSAGGWAVEQGLESIDLLKVDVEGCELEVLGSLLPLLPTVKVLYVEYDDRHARRALDRLLEPTHELYLGVMLTLDQGECAYLRSDLADHQEAIPRLRDIFARGAA